MSKYIIQDWTGRRILPTETFDTFEDGWDRVYSLVRELYTEDEIESDDQIYGEYYVELEKE